MSQHPHHPHGLPCHRGQGSSRHAPLQHPHKEVRAGNIHHHGNEQAVHGLVRVAARAHHVVQVHEREGERRGQQHHQHEVTRRLDGIRIGSENIQNLICPRQRQPAEHHAESHTHDGAVPQHTEGAREILLPQGNGGRGGTTQPHQGAQRHQQVHDGEQQPHGRDGICPAALAYVDGVHYVIERHSRHAHYGRQRILRQQPPHGPLLQIHEFLVFLHARANSTPLATHCQAGIGSYRSEYRASWNTA